MIPVQGGSGVTIISVAKEVLVVEKRLMSALEVLTIQAASQERKRLSEMLRKKYPFFAEPLLAQIFERPAINN
jgi:hypothetical protein